LLGVKIAIAGQLLGVKMGFARQLLGVAADLAWVCRAFGLFWGVNCPAFGMHGTRLAPLRARQPIPKGAAWL
jgi:hypothetical protein